MKTSNLLFGRIAVKNGFCTQDEIDEALLKLHDSKERGDTITLGEILKDKSILTDGQVLEILNTQLKTVADREDRLFGQLAVCNEFCTAGEIKECLALQKKYKKRKKVPRIGELLVKKGFLTEQERDALVHTQRRLQDLMYWKHIEANWQRSREH